MLWGHWLSAAWAQAIASFRSVIHAINIGGCAGASVETHDVPLIDEYAHDAFDPPPRRLACPSARRAAVGRLRGPYRPSIRPRHRHAQPGAAGDQGGRGGRLSRPHPQSDPGRARVRTADDLLPD